MSSSYQPGEQSDHPADHAAGHRPAWSRHLSEEDAEILDALLAATNRDHDAGRTAQQHDPERLQRVKALLALLDEIPEEADDPKRVDRTLKAVQAAQVRERFAEQSQMRGMPMPRMGLRHVAMVLVMVVLGGSLLLPVLARNRAEAQRIACAANLRMAGEAFHQYAHDHNYVLPRGKVEPGATWWNVGRTTGDDSDVVQSNSAHLYMLVRNHYIDANALACPTNPHAPRGRMSAEARDWAKPRHVSYSYQNQYTEDPWRVDLHKDLTVLADRNPLFVARRGQVVFDADTPRDAPSRGHARRGQNALSLDGTVTWTVRPYRPRAGRQDVSNRDNFWVATGVDKYTGTERPHSAEDSFLVP